MDAQTCLTTTRSVRKRLDFDRPVPHELILECIEVAVQAPTGSNRQGWHFVIVTDPDKKKVIGDLYRQSWAPYAASRGPRYAEGDVRLAQLPRVVSSSQYLADRFHEVPVMVIPYERITQAALITLGYHTGGDFKPAERIPLEPIVHWDTW